MTIKRLLTLSVVILFIFTGCTQVTTTTTLPQGTNTVTTNDTTTTTLTTQTPLIGEVTGLEDEAVIKNHYFHVLKGVQALSSTGEDITSYINISGSVDYGTVGTYDLVYSMDYFGDVFQETRTITVAEGTYVAPTGSRPTGGSETIVLDEGSYRTGTESSLTHPINPAFIEADLLSRAVPSNSWWTTLLVGNYGNSNGIYTNPLKSSFSNEGVEITNVGEGFVQYWNPGGLQTMAQYSISLKDLFLKTDSLSLGYTTKVIDYSDTSVKVAMRNNSSSEDKMVVTFAQGSPYIFAEVAQKENVTIIAGTNGVDNYEYYDLSGTKINTLTYTGNAIILKMVRRHIGYECTPPANVGMPLYADRYFLISTPNNTDFTISSGNHPFGLNNKITMDLGTGNYLSVSAIPSLTEAAFYHSHADAFVTRGTVSYDVNHHNSVVTTDYRMNVQTMGSIQKSALIALMPHQYQYSNALLTNHEVRTVRGSLKLMENNAFQTEIEFNGMLPGFTLPDNEEFSLSSITTYLNDLNTRTLVTDTENFLNADAPYWNSKALYPLSQGLIIADQTNNTSLKADYIAKLRYLLTDWYTYSGATDTKYLYYNKPWGSVYYSDNEFNTAGELSDHAFTHGYLIYASAVLAMYDSSFISEYGEMVDVLLNDYMYPVKGDSNYAYLRSFDSWAGHSWAHGFGSFAEGNNLESTSEALNSWVGGYLWALATQDQARIDAAIYGFVTEFSAIREYWFDYDEENWSEDYSTYASVAGMVWGGKFDYATWFGANPTFIYGIQWLPNGEYLTNYGINADDLAKLQLIFEDYLDAKNNVIDTWYSNMWSVLAIYNPESAIAAFDASKILNDDYPSELAGAYWMINALSSLGIRTDTVKMHSNNLVASTIYMNDDGSIYAMVWNPTSIEQTIQFYNNSAFVYQTKVQANTFTKIEIPLL